MVSKIEREKYLLYGQQRPGIVRGIDLRAQGGDTDPPVDVIAPVVAVTRPTAMDYHAERGVLYLADSHRRKILRDHPYSTSAQRGEGVGSIADSI